MPPTTTPLGNFKKRAARRCKGKRENTMKTEKFKVTPLERAWILYDVGNSAFVLMIATLVPIFFNALAEAGGVSKVDYLAYWGYASSIVTVVTAILGPILGTLADTKGFKKPIFMLCLFVGVIGCCAMGMAGTWLAFLIIFIIAKIGYSGSLVFYDSMLGDVTTPERMDMVSSRGYAWGYIGSCVPFVVCLALVLGSSAVGLSQMTALSIALVITAVWWLVVTLPLLKKYRQINYVEVEQHAIRQSFVRIGQTLKHLPQDKQVFWFLLAFFCYIDGVYTIIDMATAYGTALGLDTTGLLLAALLLAGCTSAGTARRMRMGVAGEGGVYHAFGEGFAALENDSGNGAVELKNTAGSAANLRLLMGDYLQLAVAQADLVQDAYEQSGIFQDEEMENKFCAVAALYTEACQVIVRADSDIQSVEELQGKTVSIGAEESGSEQNAWQILSAYGLNEKLVETINLNYEDAAAQLKAGRIDAMFITAGAPSAVVTALAEDCGIRLLCVDGAAAKRLQDSCSSYSVCTIPAGTYPGQEEEVQTVGVKAVLLASAALPEKQVEQLTKLLFDGRENLSTQLGIRLDTEAEATEGVGIPFHKGAAAYYKTADITVAS